MARNNKQHRKNNVITGKVPQEASKDKSTLKSVAYDDHQNRWHQCVQDLPPGKIINIPYLKQLAVHAMVPIAYCNYSDVDKVKNFVPLYLHRFTVNNKYNMELINYPTPRHERRAANDGDTAVAAIGVICNERGRSLSPEDQNGRRQVPVIGHSNEIRYSYEFISYISYYVNSYVVRLAKDQTLE